MATTNWVLETLGGLLSGVSGFRLLPRAMAKEDPSVSASSSSTAERDACDVPGEATVLLLL